MFRFSAILQLWRRFKRRWRSRLRRERAAIAVLAVLTLGLFEPLMCVLHCEFWLPLHLQQTASRQQLHQHHHTHAANVAAEASTTTVVDHRQPATTNPALCFVDMDGSGSHHHAPQAKPFHEMALIAPVLIALALLILHTAATSPPSPPQWLFAPLLRPPIA